MQTGVGDKVGAYLVQINIHVTLLHHHSKQTHAQNYYRMLVKLVDGVINTMKSTAACEVAHHPCRYSIHLDEAFLLTAIFWALVA